MHHPAAQRSEGNVANSSAVHTFRRIPGDENLFAGGVDPFHPFHQRAVPWLFKDHQVTRAQSFPPSGKGRREKKIAMVHVRLHAVSAHTQDL